MPVTSQADGEWYERYDSGTRYSEQQRNTATGGMDWWEGMQHNRLTHHGTKQISKPWSFSQSTLRENKKGRLFRNDQNV